MATRIKTVDKEIILINALNNSVTLTLVFKLLITPWSIGWTFDNFKQLVEADFSTTNSWSSYFVKWLSLFLPPEHFSDPKLNLLSGRHRKKSTNWSAVNECFNSFFQRMAWCTVSDHGVVIKFSTYLLSTPNVIWKKRNIYKQNITWCRELYFQNRNHARKIFSRRWSNRVIITLSVRDEVLR